MDSINIQTTLPYLFSIIGGILIIYPIIKSHPRRELYTKGIKAEGIIFDLGIQEQSKDITTIINLQNKVTVRFLTEKKEWITADIKNDFAVFYTSQYKIGEKISVRYNPENPSDFVVETKQIIANAKLLFIGIGLIFLLFGLVQILFPNLLSN